ncbi:MAG: FAD-dependent oxidoreductase [Chthoniobacteraceae bacterium]
MILNIKSTVTSASLLVLVLWMPVFANGAQIVETDVCIYGGAAGGVTAAVEAARQGKAVTLLGFNQHLGGMSSSGLGWTDIGKNGDSYIQGISREFYTRISGKYGSGKVKWTFEPHVAEAVFNEMVKEARVRVFLGQQLAKTEIKDRKITDITMENGNVFRAKVFIDASYEGDLLKQAGVSYTVGREGNAQYGETINGIQTKTYGHNLPDGVDPYVVKGNPASGILPGVNADPGGPDGSADSKVQAYCYRICLTNVPRNRVRIAKPPGYNAADYELLFRAIEAGHTSTFFTCDEMPNGKTDTNNYSGVSCDYIGYNYGYPEADYATRSKIAKAHENWQRGLIWTLQNHTRVPKAIRNTCAKWGLPADEFKDNNHWPYELYVREARRMVSDYVITEKNCSGEIVAEDSAGLAAYTMDSHNCQRIVLNGQVKNEGDVQKRTPKPFPISYRALVPKSSECLNLLTPWSVSASHVAFASVRMEPVFMILGQSVGMAACLAIDERCPVQDIPYNKLKAQLVKEGQLLEMDAKTGPDPAPSR